MSVQVKICGLREEVSLATAIDNGARYVGFVFYPRSPRALAPAQAAALLQRVPASVASVGLFVDPSDDDLRQVLKTAPVGMIQLHGTETPQRVADVRRLTGLPVIKAVGVATRDDLFALRVFEGAADMLLLDAKPPAGGLPGGNALAFDWALLADFTSPRPWMLAGGLQPHSVAEAVARTGAQILDVSSGVERAPGVKDPARIKEFLINTHKIATSY